jgi:hypothetical protein
MIATKCPEWHLAAVTLAPPKAAIAERLLVDVNVLFNLNERGVRDKLTPLVGFAYSF